MRGLGFSDATSPGSGNWQNTHFSSSLPSTDLTPPPPPPALTHTPPPDSSCCLPPHPPPPPHLTHPAECLHALLSGLDQAGLAALPPLPSMQAPQQSGLGALRQGLQGEAVRQAVRPRVQARQLGCGAPGPVSFFSSLICWVWFRPTNPPGLIKAVESLSQWNETWNMEYHNELMIRTNLAANSGSEC